MNKIICVLTAAVFAVLFISLAGCSDESSSDGKKESPAVTTKEATEITAAAVPASKDKKEKPAFRKYAIKSGAITFERAGVSAKKKIMVYFDDFGKKERNEVYNDKGVLEEIRFSDGETMYRISLKNSAEKAAYIMGPGSNGTEMRFEADPFKKDDEKQRQNYKKLPDMEILGKLCQAYSVKTDAAETIFAGRDNVLLHVKVIMKMGETVTQAVDFKENAEVDPALFKVPAEYAVKKYN
ncbi:MAG: hypothetical protein C4518_15875 [Desulfobacteraceae bacterium]|nr:MAG: hypothetical protein C4518_15875 [Desulfobacteraceae bacterium]